MEGAPIPYNPPPPSSSSSPQKPDLHMLYYGLIIVGVITLSLCIYNLFIMRWCSHENSRLNMEAADHHNYQSSLEQTSSRISDVNLLSSFRYKKEGGIINHDQECAVCLSAFEEGEQVRQLPSCMHSFHVSCIDMWLYSHMDCPLCRSPVIHRNSFSIQMEDSREGLLI